MYQPEEQDQGYYDENGQGGVYQPNQQGEVGVDDDDDDDEYDNPNDEEQEGDDIDVNNNQQQGGEADSYGDSFAEGEVDQDGNDVGYNGQPGAEDYTDPQAGDATEEQYDDVNLGNQGYQQQQEPYDQYGAGGEPVYDQGQPGYDDGQGGGVYNAGQSGYDAGQDPYAQSQQQYDQYGQPRASWASQQADPYAQQADPYGQQQQPDPYARQSRAASTKYGAPPEQARPVPAQEEDDLRKNVMYALICVTAVLVIVIIAVVVLLIVFLTDDDPTPTPTPITPGAPTSAPTPSLDGPGWQSASANTFSATKSGAGFGGALAIAGDTLVAGIPDKAGKPGFGTVLTYSRASGVRAFSTDGDTTEATAELFGAALDMAYDSATDTIQLAVGAPRTDGILAKIVSFGTVYIYNLDRSSETWSRVGDVIRSTETLEEAGGEFGNAVALAADVDRVAVGAPSRSLDMENLNTGGVTVYELQNNVWTTMPSTPLFGPLESYYGQAIDMSDDGTGLIVGAPGRGDFPGGQVDFFKWDGSSKWELAYTKSGTGSEQMGTTVAIINSEGTQIAYGMPGSSNTRGAVRVMEDGGSGTFTQMGDDIVGTEAGEMVGMVMCSKNSRVAVGTQTGILRVYDFSGGAWVPLLNQPDVGVAITTCAMTETGEAIVVGMANDQVKVFDLVGQ